MGGPHKETKTTLSAWIDRNKRNALREYAKSRKLSVAEVLEELIDERIGQINPGEKQAGKVKKKNKNRG